MRLRLERLRFTYVATRSVHFPFPASNKLRGSIGSRLWKREDGLYRQFFAPELAGGPSGLADAPRPFVLRSRHLDGVTITADQEFSFDLNLFDIGSRGLLKDSLQELGFGSLRNIECEPVEVSLDAEVESVSGVSVGFVTPTELKARGELIDRPEFGVLATRIRDRVSTLMQLYGAGPLAIDFVEFGERASAVRMTHCEIEHVDATRRSGRTGQVHALGGFIGEADYEGDLTPFLPYLRAAEWTGVGRQTSWGKGAIVSL